MSVYHRGARSSTCGAARPTGRTGRPYEEDTLQLVFSTTKGVTAIAANLLAQRGELDLDAQVADYWPEFGQAGKADIPVRWLLSPPRRAAVGRRHDDRSKRPSTGTPVIDALARQAPVWEPGTQHGYHATTFGWLVGEVVRRHRHEPRHLRARRARRPLGLDLWIGLPAAQHHRVAPLEVIELPDDPVLQPMVDQFIGPETHARPGPLRPGQRVGRGAVRLLQPARGVGRRDPGRQLHHRRPVAGQALRRLRERGRRAPTARRCSCSPTRRIDRTSSARPRASTRC